MAATISRFWTDASCGNRRETGTPAITLPLCQTSDGLPLGAHFIGPIGEDARLIRLSAQLEEALSLGVDAVLLDNMGPDMLRTAVAMVAGRAITEASGRIRPETARPIAEAGVDLMSVGWLTHSAQVLDIGLDHIG